jgi:hypothetical protein
MSQGDLKEWENDIEESGIMVDKKVALSSYEEKRQHPRIAVKLPVDYWQTPEVIQGGLAANISKKGLLMYSVHKIEINTKLRVRIYLSKSNSLDCIEGNGKIMWMGLHREQEWEGFKYGVYIGEMTPDYEDRLTNYLLMLQEQQNSSP